MIFQFILAADFFKFKIVVVIQHLDSILSGGFSDSAHVFQYCVVIGIPRTLSLHHVGISDIFCSKALVERQLIFQVSYKGMVGYMGADDIQPQPVAECAECFGFHSICTCAGLYAVISHCGDFF